MIDILNYIPVVLNWIVMIVILYIAFRAYENITKRIFRELIQEEIKRENEAMKGTETPKGPKIDRPPQVKSS